MQRKYDLYITKEKREQLIRETIEYFGAEQDCDIGVIAAGEILDFFLQGVGESIYNKAIEDSKIVVRQGLENLEINLGSLINR